MVGWRDYYVAGLPFEELGSRGEFRSLLALMSILDESLWKWARGGGEGYRRMIQRKLAVKVYQIFVVL